jgi:hypothetical protein
MRRASRNSVLGIAVGLAFSPLAAGMGAAAQKAQVRNTAAPAAPAQVARRAARAVAAIRRERRECRDATDYAGPTDLQACDHEASDAAGKLLVRSSQNDALNDLLSDLSDPLMVVLTPKEEQHDALVARVVLSVSYTNFAIARAALLLGPGQPVAIRNRPGAALFGWLTKAVRMESDTITARSATRRWQAIRDADCARYPVPRCAERLDETMRQMLRSVRSSG